MTKKEIIKLYLADLNNLVPNSDAKRSRIIDLENELEVLRIHNVSGKFYCSNRAMGGLKAKCEKQCEGCSQPNYC